MPTPPENHDDWTLFDLFAFLRGLRAITLSDGEPMLPRATVDWHLANLLQKMPATERAAAMELLDAPRPVTRTPRRFGMPASNQPVLERLIEGSRESLSEAERMAVDKITASIDAKRVSARRLPGPRTPKGPGRRLPQ